MLLVNELFAGIGAQSAALERLGIDFKVVGIAEIDKYAIKSYEAIHGPTRNYGDISKIKKLDYADFWTYSFPCQDISVAGKQAGIEKGKTRSGLLYEVERLLEKSKGNNELPKYLMLENVKNLVGKKFKAQFDEWLQRLDEFGYNAYWQVLNAKDYGIPQNRERVFAISIRKDLNTGYVFPEPFELKKRLKDVLQKEVDEKYYISQEKTNALLSKTKGEIGNGKLLQERNGTFGKVDIHSLEDISPCISATCYKGPDMICMGNVNPSGNGTNGNVSDGLAPTLTTNKGEGPKILQVAQIYPNSGNPEAGRINDDNGISPAMDTCQGGNRMPKIIEPCIAESRGRNLDNPSDRTVGSPTEQRLEINQNGTSNTITTVQKDNYALIPQATKQGYIECNVPGVADLSFPDSKTRRGRVQENGEICPTLMAGQQDICYIEPRCRIRKLTPLECWRLMGFTDEQFYKAEKVNSNSQLYKQAGNSIVADVLYYIFKNLFVEKQIVKQINDEEQLTGQMTIDEWLGA